MWYRRWFMISDHGIVIESTLHRTQPPTWHPERWRNAASFVDQGLCRGGTLVVRIGQDLVPTARG